MGKGDGRIYALESRTAGCRVNSGGAQSIIAKQDPTHLLTASALTPMPLTSSSSADGSLAPEISSSLRKEDRL